jgi:acetyl/propionyl-CoA carboxylase alpha subunit
MCESLRLAIVNRGEAAVRLLQTTASIGGINGRAFHTIALHTTPDRHSLFVRRAVEALDLDALPATDPAAGASPYLDIPRLMRALRECRADMVWVGWGFVAEDAEFAAACEQAGITFIGPSSTAMAALSHKIQAKELAERAGVPVTPWSGGAVTSVEEATARAAEIGYPLFVKSAAGGGGMGIREVLDPADLADAVTSARREALRAFGDDTVFLERRVDAGRHVEVQVLADSHGTVWPVGVRECSIQRRRQKVVEESGLSIPDPELEQQVRSYASAIIREAGYTNAGTVEFLIDAGTGEPHFMEVNTRLQVEHTVTEEATGLDLVEQQIRIASGLALEGTPPEVRGHAIEVRLNAEDPEAGFAPAPGRVLLFRAPQGPSIRTDTGIEQGDEISADFDSMAAKIIAWGPDRATALQRLRRALDHTEVVIEGGATNKSFLQEIVAHPDVESGNVNTRWLDELVAAGGLTPQPQAALALVQAAIEAYRLAARLDSETFIRSLAVGRPQYSDSGAIRFELGFRGSSHTIEVNEPEADVFHLRVDGEHIVATLDHVDGSARVLGVGGSTHRTFVVPGGDGTTVDVDGLPHRISADGGGTVRAGFPGMIVSVLASVGDQVEAGDTLLTIESMKLESRVLAPAAGVVREVHVGINSQVGSGEPLVRLDVVDDDDTAGDDSSVDFAALASDTPDRTPLDVLRTVVLGLDAASGETDRLSAGLLPTREDAAAQLAGELDVLAAFADIHSLGPRRAALAGRVDAPERAHLVGYLRERHREDREFPDDFLARLDTALALVGHDESDDVAHLRLYRSLRRRDLIHSALASILRRWLEPATTVPATEQVRTVLERVVWITEGRSDQLEGLARSVLFRLFSQPVLDADLAAQTAIMTERIQQIGSQSDAAERTLDLRTLAFDSPPWEAWLLGSLAGPDRPAWEDVLVVVTADNYRHRRLVQVPTPSSPAAPLLMAEELDAESDISVIAVAHLGDDTATAAALEPLIAQRAALGPVVVELLVTDGRLDLDPRLARACLAATQVNATVLPVAPEGHVAHRSWAPGPGGDLTEVALFRDLHPCLAERLELWRDRHGPGPPACWRASSSSRRRRRGQRHRRGRQRRRPVLLERRGDHAHAHPRRAHHDAPGSMVLTGKKALEYSGSVSAEDERGIGGYERIMGPNGQAQYHARRPRRRLSHPLRALPLRLRRARRARAAARPRVAATRPPRTARSSTPPTSGRPEPFATVGDVFSPSETPSARSPFAIRAVMTRGHRPATAAAARALRAMWGGETRWCGTRTSAAQRLPHRHRVAAPARRGLVIPLTAPTRGRRHAVPISSKKVARAINRQRQPPVVVLANLSGFDGSAPSPCASSSSSTAPRSAAPSSSSKGPSSSSSSGATTAAPTSCSRRPSTRGLARAGGRGRLRLRHRRRARGGRRVPARGPAPPMRPSTPSTSRAPRWATCRVGWRRRPSCTRTSRCGWRSSGPARPGPTAPTSWSRSAGRASGSTSSTGCPPRSVWPASAWPRTTWAPSWSCVPSAS